MRVINWHRGSYTQLAQSGEALFTSVPAGYMQGNFLLKLRNYDSQAQERFTNLSHVSVGLMIQYFQQG